MSLFGKKTRIPGLKSGKTRQYLTLGAILVALYMGLYLIFATSSTPKTEAIAKDAISTTHIRAAGEQVDPRDRWIGDAGTRVAEQERRLTSTEEQTRVLLERFTRLEADLRNRGATPPMPTRTPVQADPEPEPAEQAPAATEIAPPEPVSAPSSFPPATPGQAASALSGGSTLLPNWVQSASRPPPPPEPVRALGHARLTRTEVVEEGGTAPRGARSTNSVSSGRSTPAPRDTAKTFLPIGFAKAELMGGIDAPTGAQAQQNPLPVMLRIVDLGILPNHFRANVRDCFVVGAGYGDIAAERAYIRIETLSCIRHDGQALEVKAHGSVFDETGMLGVRGHVRNKQGQILANALLAGIVSGIGQGIQYQNTTSTVTPVGNTVIQPNAGNEFRAGMASGVGKALDRLANYYITLAEKIFPVIEVQARRQVDIAFTKGIALDIPLPDLAFGEFYED